MTALPRFARSLLLFAVGLIVGRRIGIGERAEERPDCEQRGEQGEQGEDPCGGTGSRAAVFAALEARPGRSSAVDPKWSGGHLATIALVSGSFLAMLVMAWWVQGRLHPNPLPNPPPTCWEFARDLPTAHQLTRQDVFERGDCPDGVADLEIDRVLGLHLLEAVSKGDLVVQDRLAKVPTLGTRVGFELLVFEPEGIPRVLVGSLRVGQTVRLCAGPKPAEVVGNLYAPAFCVQAPVAVRAVHQPPADEDLPWIAVEVPSAQVETATRVITAERTALFLVGTGEAGVVASGED